MYYGIEISNEAEDDLDDAFMWYEIQKKGLGEDFVRSLDRSLNLIVKNPMAFIKVYGDIHRSLISRFPYIIYYLIDESEMKVRIIGVIHASRHEDIWKQRR